MSTAQINARIDSAVKLAGDRGLSEAGYTPTKAIRILWEFAGRNRHNISVVRKTLEGMVQPENMHANEVDERVRRAEQAPDIIEAALAELGVQHAGGSELSDEELLEAAYIDKMAERGTLL